MFLRFSVLFLIAAAAVAKPRSIFENVKVVGYSTRPPNEKSYTFYITQQNDLTNIQERKIIKAMIADQKIPLIPKNCFRNKSDVLEELIFTNTGIRKIESGAFSGPQSLKVLVIRNNDIQELSARPFKLTNLETLIFSNNKLVELDPNSFDGLPKLDKLDLSGNRLHIQSLSVALKPIPTLHSIDLSRNAIKYIGDGTFKYMSKFPDDIILSDNQLTGISPKAFMDEARIENLTLFGNHLSDLDLTNKQIRGVIRLDLRRNNIECLDPKHVRKVVVVKADGNPWNCDCFKKYHDEKGPLSEVWAPSIFKKCGMSQYLPTYINI